MSCPPHDRKAVRFFGRFFLFFPPFRSAFFRQKIGIFPLAGYGTLPHEETMMTNYNYYGAYQPPQSAYPQAYPQFQQAVPYTQAQYQPPVQAAQAQPQRGTPSTLNLAWVNGFSGAQAYITAPNSTNYLFDDDAHVFYIKSSDCNGKCEIKSFKFEECEKDNAPDYITREEFNLFKQSLSKKETAENE